MFARRAVRLLQPGGDGGGAYELAEPREQIRARRPSHWDPVGPSSSEATDKEQLSTSWDLVVQGIEHDILSLHDTTCKKREQHSGRRGAPQFKWARLRWPPPRRRPPAITSGQGVGVGGRFHICIEGRDCGTDCPWGARGVESILF